MENQKIIQYVEENIDLLSHHGVEKVKLKFHAKSEFFVDLYLEHGRVWFYSNLDLTKGRIDKFYDYLDNVDASFDAKFLKDDDCYL